MRSRETFDALDRSDDILAGPARDRPQLGDRTSVASNDEAFPLLDTLKELREVRFRFVDADFGQGSLSNQI